MNTIRPHGPHRPLRTAHDGGERAPGPSPRRDACPAAPAPRARVCALVWRLGLLLCLAAPAPLSAQVTGRPPADPEATSWIPANLPRRTLRSAAELETLLARLGSPVAGERAEAALELLEFGAGLEPILRRLPASDDEEVRHRVRDLLLQLGGKRDGFAVLLEKRRASLPEEDFAAWLSDLGEGDLARILTGAMGESAPIGHPLYRNECYRAIAPARLLPLLLDLLAGQTAPHFRQRVARLLAEAALGRSPDHAAALRAAAADPASGTDQVLALLRDPDPWMRYWGVRIAAGLRLAVPPDAVERLRLDLHPRVSEMAARYAPRWSAEPAPPPAEVVEWLSACLRAADPTAPLEATASLRALQLLATAWPRALIERALRVRAALRPRLAWALMQVEDLPIWLDEAVRRLPPEAADERARLAEFWRLHRNWRRFRAGAVSTPGEDPDERELFAWTMGLPNAGHATSAAAGKGSGAYREFSAPLALIHRRWPNQTEFAGFDPAWREAYRTVIAQEAEAGPFLSLPGAFQSLVHRLGCPPGIQRAAAPAFRNAQQSQFSGVMTVGVLYEAAVHGDAALREQVWDYAQRSEPELRRTAPADPLADLVLAWLGRREGLERAIHSTAIPARRGLVVPDLCALTGRPEEPADGPAFDWEEWLATEGKNWSWSERARRYVPPDFVTPAPGSPPLAPAATSAAAAAPQPPSEWLRCCAAHAAAADLAIAGGAVSGLLLSGPPGAAAILEQIRKLPADDPARAVLRALAVAHAGTPAALQLFPDAVIARALPKLPKLRARLEDISCRGPTPQGAPPATADELAEFGSEFDACLILIHTRAGNFRIGPAIEAHLLERLDRREAGIILSQLRVDSRAARFFDATLDPRAAPLLAQELFGRRATPNSMVALAHSVGALRLVEALPLLAGPERGIEGPFGLGAGVGELGRLSAEEARIDLERLWEWTMQPAGSMLPPGFPPSGQTGGMPPTITLPRPSSFAASSHPSIAGAQFALGDPRGAARLFAATDPSPYALLSAQFFLELARRVTPWDGEPPSPTGSGDAQQAQRDRFESFRAWFTENRARLVWSVESKRYTLREP